MRRFGNWICSRLQVTVNVVTEILLHLLVATVLLISTLERHDGLAVSMLA